MTNNIFLNIYFEIQSTFIIETNGYKKQNHGVDCL
jgi:hypothetical protein